jgi:rhodanese-related sulfurtransferase
VAQQKENASTATSVEIKNLTAEEFDAALKADKDAVILDVRTPEEVAKGKIPGAINVDFNGANFKKEIKALDKRKKYFVYCAKGGRSIKAVDTMVDLGFKNVTNLEEGFGNWQEKGMPVVK